MSIKAILWAALFGFIGTILVFPMLAFAEIASHPARKVEIFSREPSFNEESDTLKNIDACNRALLIYPNDPSTYSFRAALRSDINDNLGALADYTQAIRLEPEYALAYSRRGLLKQNKFNDIKGALADYEQAIRIAPDLVDVYYNRANLRLKKLNDIEGALADYSRLIQRSPDFAEAWLNRGLIKFQQFQASPQQQPQDRSGAVADVRQAAKLAQTQNDPQLYEFAINQLKKWGIDN
jgi:tetratricopeptide (TPR) repeat protein